MAESQDRLYAIKPDEGYFFTGVTTDSDQLLMGLFCPNLVAFRFDLEGNLGGCEEREVPFFRDATPPYDIYDERIAPMVEAWQSEMRFRPATIRVKKFFSDEHSIGIEDYPSHFHEILSDPASDESEKADVRDSMALWDNDGQFVLLWGTDYWLDRSGHVVSS